MGRVSGIRGPPHTWQGEGKRQWELVWRNRLNKQRLQWAAPYYPIIYIAWESGNAEWTLAFTEKTHSMPHANQKSRHYGPSKVLNTFRLNVFFFNNQEKWLHHQQTSSSDTAALWSLLQQNRFNNIITFKIVFAQSVAGLNVEVWDLTGKNELNQLQRWEEAKKQLELRN